MDVTPAPRRLVATCGGCDNWWSGYSMCHCAECHHTFGGVGSFDRHRAHGTCTTPSELGLRYIRERRCWSDQYRGTRE